MNEPTVDETEAFRSIVGWARKWVDRVPARHLLGHLSVIEHEISIHTDKDSLGAGLHDLICEDRKHKPGE